MAEKKLVEVEPLSNINLIVNEECYSCAEITDYDIDDNLYYTYYTTHPLQYKGKITNIEINPKSGSRTKTKTGELGELYSLTNIVTFEDGTKIFTDDKKLGFIPTKCQNIFSKIISNFRGCTGPQCVNGGKHQSRRYRKTKRSRKTRRHRKTKKSRKYRK
jgi:hypothetical protein